MRKYKCLIIGLLLCLALCGCKSTDYKNAAALYEEGAYLAAREIYFELGDYKDSAQKAEECTYQLGISAMENAQWESAVAYFRDSALEGAEEKVAECTYQLGQQAMQEENWDEAIGYFGETDFSDSKEMLRLCEKEKGMAENADNGFLADIEKSVQKRGELSDANAAYLELVNGELAILEKYAGQTFYDDNLKQLADKYLNGLYIQKEATSLSYSEYQIKWQEGLVTRYEALCALKQEYDAFAENTDFVSTYVMELENQQKRLTMMREIDADLLAQLDGVTLQYESTNYGSAMYTNNTAYDFDINFFFWYYDQNGIRFDEYSTHFTNVISGQTNKFTFYCPARARTFDFFWEIIPHIT